MATEVIRIAELAAETNSLIERRTFERRIIVGPAVLAPLEGVTISNSSFDADPESLFIEIPDGRRVTGVIGLRHVTFERCEFRNIALAGTPESVAQFRQGFQASGFQGGAFQGGPIQEAPPPDET